MHALDARIDHHLRNVGVFASIIYFFRSSPVDGHIHDSPRTSIIDPGESGYHYSACVRKTCHFAILKRKVQIVIRKHSPLRIIFQNLTSSAKSLSQGDGKNQMLRTGSGFLQQQHQFIHRHRRISQEHHLGWNNTIQPETICLYSSG